MSNIAIFGDSIVHGVLDLEKGGWAERLKVDLWNDESQSQSEVYVFGIDGSATKDLLNRFDVELSSMLYGLDVVILAIGINDTSVYKNGEKGSTTTSFGENIEKLIKKAQKKVGHVYICGLTQVTEELVSPLPVSKSGKSYQNDRIAVFDEILRFTSTEYDCHFISLQTLLKKEDLADGLHPNAQGHEKIFRHVKQLLIETNII